MEPVRGNVVVLPVPQASIQMNAMLSNSQKKIYDTFNILGRFIPVELNRVDSAIKDFGEIKKVSDYDKVAAKLNVPLYILLSSYGRGNTYYIEMKVVSLDSAYSHLRRNIVIKSKDISMLPTKCALEIAKIHRNLPLRITVQSCSTNSCIINAGQWHGLEGGSLNSDEGTPLQVRTLLRYRSIIEKTPGIEKGTILILRKKPDTENVIKKLGKELESQILYRYGAENTTLKKQNPEKRFIAGACVINPGANACLPGYGAYLATGYLQLSGKPYIPGVVAASTLTVMHFTFTEMLTGFRSNFFPWIQDGNKSDGMKNMHIFLWASLPVTLTNAWLQQLAHQYRNHKSLPPFFRERDGAAVAFSFFSPGAGLMYKGYTAIGWGYYAIEMSLSSLTAWYGGRSGDKWMYLLAGLGSVKIIELVHAWLVEPNYAVYRFEKEPAKRHAVFSFMMRPSIEEGDAVFAGGMTLSF